MQAGQWWNRAYGLLIHHVALAGMDLMGETGGSEPRGRSGCLIRL